MENTDITISGMIAGLTGGIGIMPFGIAEKYIHLADRTFHDFSQALIMSKLHPGILGIMVGVLAHLGISMLGTIAFAHYIIATSKKNILIKGMFFGTSMWIILLGAGTFYKMPEFAVIPPRSALCMYFNSAVWGLFMSFILNKLLKENTWSK